MKNAIEDIINVETSLFNKIYTKSFRYFPETLKDEIIKRLLQHADTMSDIEEAYLEKWDMTNYPKKIIIDESVIRKSLENDRPVNVDILPMNESAREENLIKVPQESSENNNKNVVSDPIDLHEEASICFDEIIKKLQDENTALKNNNATLRRYLQLALQSIEGFDEDKSTN